MGNIRTLIVDDSPSFRETLQTYLDEQPGIELVGVAENGEECLGIVARQQIDVVIMDARMPGLDGPQTTQKLKQDHPGIKVIICTIWAEQEARDYAAEAGADDYFVKGDKTSVLLGKIFSVLRTSS